MFWQIILIPLMIYILYTRILRFYYKIYFYKFQGVPFPNLIVPFFGTLLQTSKIAKNAKNHPVVDFCQDTFYKGKKIVPQLVGLSGGTGVALIIGRPEAAEDLFLTKNKYFDKHPRSSQ
jgi:hypothetical protein